MRTNLHSLGPVATRHFSACPTHVATTPGKRRSVKSRRDARNSMGYSHGNVVNSLTMRYGGGNMNGMSLYFYNENKLKLNAI